jgi:hypothetical protein
MINNFWCAFLLRFTKDVKFIVCKNQFYAVATSVKQNCKINVFSGNNKYGAADKVSVLLNFNPSKPSGYYTYPHQFWH